MSFILSAATSIVWGAVAWSFTRNIADVPMITGAVFATLTTIAQIVETNSK